MNYQAKWGKKGFLVSPTKIVPFESFKAGLKMKSDSKNDTSGKDPKNTRGVESQSFSFSATYLRAAGVDPRAQYEEWCGEIGKSYPLYIGGKRFGPAKMELTSVDISESIISPRGDFIKVVLAIQLTEDSSGKSTAATRKTTSTSSSAKAAATYKATVEEKKAAMNATASKSDKSAKKTSGGGGSR